MSFLAGLGWGVLSLLGIEAVIAVKTLKRSGGALKIWAAMRKARTDNPTQAKQAAKVTH